MGFFRHLKVTLEMIKFEHTVFALPFALLSAILASGGWPEAPKLFWIVMAMVGARSAAMAFNRIADQQIDAENPRTKMRALPAGELTASFTVLFTVASAALFVGAAWKLNPLCFTLSVPVLAILFFYSYTKLFTSYSSRPWVLLGNGAAGILDCIAGTSDVPVLLCAIVMLWTAGFDIIYACQDVEFDRRNNVLAAKATGFARPSMYPAQCTRSCCCCWWRSSLGDSTGSTGGSYWWPLLWYEHSLVGRRPFQGECVLLVNGCISICFLAVDWTS
jgi:4-hydroxybenzoate polyprenyltransferase